MALQHLFGPVPSRRLGISLGIDLVPFKTCTYDCVYCECGPTTTLTTDGKEWIPTDTVIAEIDEYLGAGPALNYCTYSGSGEPTLHSGLGRITIHLRESFPEYRIALLTNGSLFRDPDVRAMTDGIDVIIPSLDAATPAPFSRINRPHPSLDIAGIIGGLADLRNESDAEIWLEIFVVPGCNDTKRPSLHWTTPLKRSIPTGSRSTRSTAREPNHGSPPRHQRPCGGWRKLLTIPGWTSPPVPSPGDL